MRAFRLGEQQSPQNDNLASQDTKDVHSLKEYFSEHVDANPECARGFVDKFEALKLANRNFVQAFEEF